MLAQKDRLIFPTLVCTQDKLESKAPVNKWGKPASLYKLDWTHLEMKEPSLPEAYDTLLKEREFAINDDYLQEIRRLVQCAENEGGMYRPFDTHILEICLEPAQTFVRAAFYLLADCQHVPGNSPWKRSCVHAMLHKFWFHQTGRGLIYKLAGLHELEASIQRMQSESYKDCKGQRDLDWFQSFWFALKQHSTPKYLGDKDCPTGGSYEKEGPSLEPPPTGPFVLDFIKPGKDPVTIKWSDIRVNPVKLNLYAVYYRGYFIGSFEYVVSDPSYYMGLKTGQRWDHCNFKTNSEDEMISYLFHRYYETKITFTYWDMEKSGDLNIDSSPVAGPKK